MARVLVFSGAGPYADPWHPFAETSAAVAELLLDNRLDTVVREGTPGSLLDVLDFDLLVINAGGRDGEADAEETTAWTGDHRALGSFHRAGLPILALHAAVGTFRDWPEWGSIIGGRWGEDAFHPAIGTATFHPAAGAELHPVWEGLKEVVAFDERYSNLGVSPGSVPTIQHESEDVTHTMGWIAGGTVVYDGLGHDGRSYESEGRRRLLVSEAQWLLGH